MKQRRSRRRVTKEEEEQSSPRMLLNRNGDKRGNRMRHAADGAEERANNDSGIVERPAAASGRKFQYVVLVLVCMI